MLEVKDVRRRTQLALTVTEAHAALLLEIRGTAALAFKSLWRVLYMQVSPNRSS